MASDAAVPDEALVTAVRGGDREAFAVLFERWFDRVYDVARNVVRDPDTAADVAQDTFVLAWERLDGLAQVSSFGGWLLRIARNRALDRLRHDGRARPVDGDVVTDLRDAGAPDPVGPAPPPAPEEEVLAADRDQLVHAAAVALGERDMSLLDLHLRHGLSPAEIAEELGVTANNAHQLLFRLRGRLGTAIGALLLWRRGRPVCPDLGAALLTGGGGTAAPVGTASFDAGTVQTVERHRRGCERCSGLRAAMVSPAQLFAAAPVPAAPVVAHEQVRQGLAEAGVPVPDLPAVTPAAPRGDGAGEGGTGDGGTGDGDGSGTGDGVDGVDGVGGDPPAPDGTAGPRPRRRRAAVALLAAVAVLVPAVVWLAQGTGAAEPDPTLATTDGASAPPASTGPALPSAVPFPAPAATGDAAPTVPAQARSGDPSTRPDGLVDTTTTDGPSPTATATATGGAPVRTTSPTAPGTPTTTPTGTATTPTRTTTTTATTAPATSTTTTTAPPPAPPVISGFRVGAGPVGVLCADPAQAPRSFVWSATGATGAVLTVGSVTRQVEPSGSLAACARSGDTAVLTVEGPGGTAGESRVVP